MKLSWWLAGWKGIRSSARARPRRRSLSACRLQLEVLENRLAPALATVSISNSQVVEGNSGTVNMDFTVTRTGDLTSTIVVGYQTVDGLAVAGTDFQGTSTGTVTIPSGSATADILVPVIGNAVNQPDRTFDVQGLTGVQNVIGPPVSLSTTSQTIATSPNSFSVAAGDVNGDGKPDLVVTNCDEHGFGAAQHDGAGRATATFATLQTFAAGADPDPVALADVNGDGLPDLLVGQLECDSTVSVLLNQTTPGSTTAVFAAQQTLQRGPSPTPLRWATSTATASPTSSSPTTADGTVSVLLNTTAPGATDRQPSPPSRPSPPGPGPSPSRWATSTATASPTCVVANFSDSTVSVLLNTTTPGAATATFAHPADLRCRGRSRFRGAGRRQRRRPARPLCRQRRRQHGLGAAQHDDAGLGHRLLRHPETFATGICPGSRGVADVNGDGMPDLAIATCVDGTVSVLLNTTAPGATTASFATQQTFAAGAVSNWRGGGGRQRRRPARPRCRQRGRQHGVGAAEYDGISLDQLRPDFPQTGFSTTGYDYSVADGDSTAMDGPISSSTTRGTTRSPCCST